MIDRTVAAVSTIVGTISALAVDLLWYSGDVLAAILVWMVSDFDLMVQFIAYLSTLARHVEWLPAQIIEQAYISVLVVFLTILAIRMVASWRGS